MIYKEHIHYESRWKALAQIYPKDLRQFCYHTSGMPISWHFENAYIKKY